MENPTLSPQSNRLLEMCHGVLKGEKTPEELSNLLEEMYEGLEKARNDFVVQVESQTEEYQEKMALEAKMVVESFEDYQIGLDKITEFFSTNNTNSITEGMDIIIQATNEILDTLTVYEAKSLQMGPTSFPILNMLILLSDGYKKGDVEEDEFRFMIYNATEYFKKMVEEANGYKGNDAKDAILMLKDGYLKFIEGLKKLDEAALAHNELMIDDALEVIRESQEIMKSGYEKFNEEMFMSGPTESPFVNIIIATIKGVKDGTFPKELLAENLEKYQEHMNEMRIEIEGVSSIPIENEDITNELPNTLKALDLSDEACDLIRAFLNDGNQAHFDPAIEKLKESTVLLKESQVKYDEIGEREGKMACIKCGELNDQNNNMCTKCGAMLPKKFDGAVGASTFAVGESGEIASGDGQQFVMTENLKKLIDESAKVRDGMITFEQYSVTLNEFDRTLQAAVAQADNAPSINLETFPENKREEAAEQKKLAEETLAILHDGLNQFMDAIDILRQFADGDVEHLRQGLQEAVEASMKLYQVQKISEVTERELNKLEKGEEAGGVAEPVATYPSSESYSPGGLNIQG